MRGLLLALALLWLPASAAASTRGGKRGRKPSSFEHEGTLYTIKGDHVNLVQGWRKTSLPIMKTGEGGLIEDRHRETLFLIKNEDGRVFVVEPGAQRGHYDSLVELHRKSKSTKRRTQQRRRPISFSGPVSDRESEFQVILSNFDRDKLGMTDSVVAHFREALDLETFYRDIEKQRLSDDEAVDALTERIWNALMTAFRNDTVQRAGL